MTPATTTATSAYAGFLQEVTRAHIEEWLPPRRCTVAQLGPADDVVLEACARHDLLLLDDLDALFAQPADSLDRLLGDADALSGVVATEVVLGEITRVLRPGGTALLTVDSLTGGMARLAAQSRWAELADVPSADVVLVPGALGGLRRCFWPDDLRALVTDSGLEVTSLVARTVLSAVAVERALAEGAGIPALVRTERALALHREDGGDFLVVTATKPLS